MGQAWCKEKTNKAQDSKSPLDRVFVRCAHRIYPSLKEEGSVLGGATQRVTSSEIGYAGSPPRDVLTRGRSIDSVDRPFHPSEWVDVNLEVPSTPRASSVLTNLTVDTSLYPATTPTSSCSNLKDVTPVPPPRRRKKNRGRPLPPKPDEIPGNAGNLKRVDTNEEPLYSSVKSPKLDNDGEEVEGERQKGKSCTFEEDSKQEGRRAKEIYEHKVNGTGRIIPSDVVSGNKRPPGSERKSSRNADPSAQNRKVHEDEEYERFARSQSIKDSSTPNHQDRRKSKDLEKQVNDRSTTAEHRPEANGRPKNYSTVSLPNYDELDATRHRQHCQKGPQSDGEKKPRRPVRSSTGSLPVESILSPFSQKTSVLFEDYVPRRGSSEHLLPYQVLGKLGRSENGVDDGGFVKYDPSKLEDWDLSDIGNCELNHRQCSSESSPVTRITGENVVKDRRTAGSEDVVDSSQNVETDEIETFRRPDSTTNIEARNVPQGSAFIQKPDAFGKAPASGDHDGDAVSKGVDEWIVGQHRSLRYFDPPTLADCNCFPDSDSSPAVCRVPFFLNEDVQVKANDTIGGSCTNGVVEESERSGLPTSRTIFARSLSNESEPYEDSYESKDLRGRVSPVANLIRTISEESLPREMLDEVEIVALATDDDFFDEKLAKDAHNKLKKDGVEQRVIVKTPPPSPEPKIKAEILDNDHSTLLKVLKDEAHEESNLSSMTPSLTELEAALSDMLEKEEPQEEANKDIDDVTKRVSISPSAERPIEPSIVPTGKASSFLKEAKDLTRTGDVNLVDEDRMEAADKASVSLGQILEDAKPATKGRKVSFCAWEETAMEEIDLRNGGEDEVRLAEEFLDDAKDLSSGLGNSVFFGPGSVFGADEAPEKPSRLHKSNVDESMENVADIPTPPRRRHKNVGGRESHKGSQNGAKDSDNYHTDRLI